MRFKAQVAAAVLAALAPVRPAAAVDPGGSTPGSGSPTGGFLATCEDLGGFCFADACGRDQIEATLNCRARCPSAAVMSVVPAACAIPRVAPDPVLRRRG